MPERELSNLESCKELPAEYSFRQPVRQNAKLKEKL